MFSMVFWTRVFATHRSCQTRVLAKEKSMDISDRLGISSIEEEMEPFLAETVELIQKRRSQGRIIFDRFLRNRVAVGGAVFLIFLFLYCFAGPLIWRVDPNLTHFTKVSD